MLLECAVVIHWRSPQNSPPAKYPRPSDGRRAAEWSRLDVPVDDTVAVRAVDGVGYVAGEELTAAATSPSFSFLE